MSATAKRPTPTTSLNRRDSAEPGTVTVGTSQISITTGITSGRRPVRFRK
jgi:hypothetical protein